MSSPKMSSNSPSLKYLQLIGQRIEQIRADVPKLTALGETMAKPLLAGGSLFTPQIGTYWPSEFGGRSGGLMGLKPATYLAESSNDVAFTTLPDHRTWKRDDDENWRRLLASRAQIVVIGRPEDVQGISPQRFAGFTGGAGADEGLYAHGKSKPLAPMRPFEQLVRGWVTTGEMVAACTRGGRMPIIWM